MEAEGSKVNVISGVMRDMLNEDGKWPSAVCWKDVVCSSVMCS